MFSICNSYFDFFSSYIRMGQTVEYLSLPRLFRSFKFSPSTSCLSISSSDSIYTPLCTAAGCGRDRRCLGIDSQLLLRRATTGRLYNLRTIPRTHAREVALRNLYVLYGYVTDYITYICEATKPHLNVFSGCGKGTLHVVLCLPPIIGRTPTRAENNAELSAYFFRLSSRCLISVGPRR